MAIHVTPIPSTIELGTPAFTLGSTNTAGGGVTAVASNSTIDIWAVPTVNLGTAFATGSAATGIRSDSTLLVFDAAAASSQGIADQSGAGSASVVSHRDHVHGNLLAFAMARLYGH